MKYLVTLTTITIAFGLAQAATAQTDTVPESTRTIQSQTSPIPTSQVRSAPGKIGYRLKDWKTMHANSADEARITIATLKKLGCEVQSDDHGNHIDVKYRCPEWRSMKLATDQLVNQWTTWCAGKGLETIVMDPSSTTQKPTVAFRLPIERNVHLHDAEQANQILNTLKVIGCEVTSNQHGDHIDATYRCPEWVTIELPSEANAHAWQKWLDESGFETQHTH